jgi:hypothetical protein
MAALLALAVSPAVAGGQGGAPAFLKGNIISLDASNVPLAAKIEQAGTQARKSGGGVFFAAYIFESRHRIHHGSEGSGGQGFSVTEKNARIRVDEKNRIRRVTSTSSEDKPSPAVCLILHEAAKSGSVLDLSLLDPDETYEVEETAVYWLGQASTDESLGLLEKSFAGTTDEHAKKSLLFAIGCHTGPRPVDLLKNAALGQDSTKVRETAVFWLGNQGDSRSLAALKEVYAGEKERSVKRQVVFALQLSKQKEAMEELVRIAKKDPDQDIRKNAIFWLGQKASQESVEALKGIVDAPDEADPIKDQAVFALSQLPKDKSVPILIDIAKTNRSLAVRKRAIFWLGQTGDPAALKFFEDILLKK